MARERQQVTQRLASYFGISREAEYFWTLSCSKQVFPRERVGLRSAGCCVGVSGWWRARLKLRLKGGSRYYFGILSGAWNLVQLGAFKTLEFGLFEVAQTVSLLSGFGEADFL